MLTRDQRTRTNHLVTPQRWHSRLMFVSEHIVMTGLFDDIVMTRKPLTNKELCRTAGCPAACPERSRRGPMHLLWECSRARQQRQRLAGLQPPCHSDARRNLLLDN